VILITAAARGLASPFEQVHVNTAAEMREAVLAHLPRATTVIMAAAVSDYRVLEVSAQKLKKTDDFTLKLTRNDDILREIVLRRSPGTIVMGFAAETERVLEEGRRKLYEKGVDAMVVNDVSRPDSGFEVDRNAGVLLTRDEEVVLAPSSKRQMAAAIVDYLASMRRTCEQRT
jgi:phosphopantothenoylcysteine decarboxylase/phosphopantothenate--cysteine ligase